MIGMILGNRYEILKEIGSGGMANVYLAHCRLLNRNVAVKILKNEFVNDGEFLERFNKEAQAAAAISSPNIVNVYDVGHDGDTHYIVMEYVEGQTLKEYIDENGMLSWQETVEYATQICSALDRAHKNNIVHRDIKPQNIILTSDGILKVTDFGIARASSNETLNVGESTMGSVHYFSPEQARGGFTDAKSDIYSLGVVMYELVTGILPFTGETPIAIAIKHMQQKPISPKEFNISVPLAVENIILKAMSKEQSLRYQSAAEMLADLNKVAVNPELIPETNSEDGNTIKYEPVSALPEEAPEKNESTQHRNVRNEKNVKNKKKLGKNNDNKGVKSAVILAILAAFAVFGLIILLGLSVLGGFSKEIEIPDIVGMKYEAAVAEYGDEFTITVEKNLENEEYPPGYIIEQNPVGGRTTKNSKEIKVSVSKDSESFIMGDFVGAKLDFFMGSLQSKINEYDIEVVKIEETSSEFGEDEIIRTIPDKNKKVSKGETITVYVSIGKPVEMPDLIGAAYGDAKVILSTAGLEIKNVSPSGATDDYIVEWQSIEPYDEVVEGTEVNLRLKEAPKPENDEPDTPEVPDAPAVPETPEVPDAPDTPVTTDTSETTDVPATTSVVAPNSVSGEDNLPGSETVI